MQIVLSGVLALVVAMTAALSFRHATEATPALLVPRMNLFDETSDGLSARLARWREMASHRDSARPKLIALTFDDGPYPVFTPLLLDELKSLHVHATFFLIGRDAEQWPEITRRIVADGNEVADHTYSHPDLDAESMSQVREEVTHGRDALWHLTHDPSVLHLMRPPHGRYTLQTLEAVQSLGYDVVLWTDDPGDWRTITPATIESHVYAYATAPEILLLHSGKLPTIQALPAIVARFRKAGYTFVTAGQLIQRVTPYALNHATRRSLS